MFSPGFPLQMFGLSSSIVQILLSEWSEMIGFRPRRTHKAEVFKKLFGLFAVRLILVAHSGSNI